MATTPELDEISAAIHDEYFSIERLEHAAERKELRVPIYAGRWKTRWSIVSGRPPQDPPPPPIASLIVRNATDVAVEDQADIGWYSVSRLEYDAESEELRIISNFPCEVVVRCAELDVELRRD